MARYFPNGALDTSFGVNGRVRTPVRSNQDVARSLVILPDGKILVGGSSQDDSEVSEFVVVRYNVNGSIDTTFNGDGKAFPDISGTFDVTSEVAYDLALRDDGKIIIGGYYDADPGPNDNWDFAYAQLNPTGSVDYSNNSPGINSVSFATPNDKALAVAVDSQHRVILGGHVSIGGRLYVALTRLLPDGTFDTAFSDDGRIVDTIGDGDAQIDEIVLQPDGKLLVSGFATFNGSRRPFLTRYDEQGNVDGRFGIGGYFIADVANIAAPVPMALAIDGSIVAAVSPDNPGSHYDFAIAKLFGDVPLITSHFPITIDEDLEDVEVNVHHLFNDLTDDDDEMVYSIRYSSIDDLFSGSTYDPTTGILTITTHENANGVSQLVVAATDRSGLSTEYTVQVTVRPVNDPPIHILPAGPFIVDEDTPITLGHDLGLSLQVDDVDGETGLAP